MRDRSSEEARVALLRELLGGGDRPHVLCGIGDDAAILAAPPGEQLVWTVDAVVEGVHFRRDLMTPEDLGYRATMAAASDLAAMGATPVALLAALVLPDDVDDDDLRAFAAGQREACDALRTAIVGGNLARGGELSITTTALGSAPRPLRRTGAHAGHAIALAGPVGLAAAGLALLERKAPTERASAARAVAAYRRPRARIAEGVRARRAARAAIDVSDGLAIDLARLARASGVDAVLYPEALITPDLARVAARLRADPLELALHGGDDYAIVVAGEGVNELPGFIQIGVCLERGAGAGDVALLRGGGELTPVPTRGFDHFGGAGQR